MNTEAVALNSTENTEELQAAVTNTIGIMSIVLGGIGLFLTPTVIFAPIALITAVVALAKEPTKILPILGIGFALMGVVTSPMCILLLGLGGFGSLF